MKKHPMDTHKAQGSHMCRRSFLKAGALALGTCLFPQVILGAVNTPRSPERTLSFYNTHTGESLKSTYWVKDEYIPGALKEINHILRDFRTEEIRPIDKGLLDLLSTIREELGSSEQFHIISGYRSAATNASLRKQSGGVAGHSLHMQGMAADIRLPGCSLSALRQKAVALGGGGVGYYPASDFVHVDIGRVRYW